MMVADGGGIEALPRRAGTPLSNSTAAKIAIEHPARLNTEVAYIKVAEVLYAY